MKNKLSRREFIVKTGYYTLASSAMMSTMGVFQKALAATSGSGYKALVCVHLNGGNNGHNFILPMPSNSAYSTYASARGGLAIANPLALGSTGYGIHPSCPELQTLFNNKQMAVLCNVGTLVQPLTLAQYKAGASPIPFQLFSHSDQSAQFLSVSANDPSGVGWGGKIADLFLAKGQTPNLAYNINSSNTANTWQVGANSTAYYYGSNGAPTMGSLNYNSYRNGTRTAATTALISQGASSTNPMVQQYAKTMNSATSKVSIVNNALSASGDFKTVFPADVPGSNGFSSQLHQVARIIKAQSQLGDSRQLFFVELGGFDTHQNELSIQASLLTYVSQYLNAFMNAMTEIGQQNNVTTFTTSDFGRTLSSNSTGGADHGWGSHHVIIGGAVQGGKMFGTFPDLTIGGPNDVGLGRLLPTTSADQMAATLATWFGVAASDLSTVFPNVANFPTSNLGFMG